MQLSAEDTAAYSPEAIKWGTLFFFFWMCLSQKYNHYF